QLVGLKGINTLIVIITVTALVIFLTEITSNTATASMIYPVMASVAAALKIHPYALLVAAGVAASCGFILPVAAAPNCVVCGSGYFTIPNIANAGFALNVIGILLVSLTIYFLLPILWGIDFHVIPDAFIR